MPRRVLPLLVLGFGLVLAAAAQEMYFPYYGRNRVLYEQLPWKSYATEHFTVHFYTDDDRLLKNVVDSAESAYRKLSGDLKHELVEPVPLIYYTTFTDFEQSNVFQVAEGVLGVSEPVLFRVGVHGDMPLDELQNLIAHELAHIFEFDILWGHQGGALTALTQPPLWTFEGLSEYATETWSSWSTLILRDSVLNDRIPEFSPSGELFPRYPLPRDPAYDFGHAIYEYMVEKYGANSIRELWLSLKSSGSSLLAKRDPLERTFKVKPREFGQDFKRWLRARFKDFFARENPEDYSSPLGPEYPINPYYFAFSPAVSPSGDLVATVTYNALDGDIDIVLLSTKDGKVLKNITKGLIQSYDHIKYEIDPANGPSLAWSPDGDRLAFFGREGRRHTLYLISALDGSFIRKYPLALDQPAGPRFSPDGRRIFLAAFAKGVRDLYALDLDTSAVVNLTQDDLYEKAPAVSPDGRSLAYTVRLGTEDQIFLSPLDDLGRRRQLTFGPGSSVCPSFSTDGGTVYYAGDARQAYNIYSLALATGEVRRHTDVRTGNFYPAPLPGEPGRFVFASFNKGSFQLFKSTAPGVVEGTAAFVDKGPGEAYKRFEPVLSFAIDKSKVKARKGMGKLYVTARPPVDAIVSTDGSIYGGSALSFSDILGDHTFNVQAYQVREFRSLGTSYLNQKGRFQFMVSAFQYSLFYYPDFYYYDPSLFSRLTYRDAIATRKITGFNAAGYYPFSPYLRLEAGLGYYHYEEDFYDPYGLSMYTGASYGYFINGQMAVASFALTGETTVFKYPYGPAAGRTFRLGLSQGLPVAEAFLRNTTIEADFRQYIYLGADIVAAFRWQGQASLGRDKFISYYGGNNQVRSAYYYNIVGTEHWILNAELRLPLLTSLNTLIGSLGPVRGVLFFDMTRNRLAGNPAKFFRYDEAKSTDFAPYYHELDAIGSIGYGFQAFFLGLPIHLEFTRRLEWPDAANPFRVKAQGDFLTKFWIGFDF